MPISAKRALPWIACLAVSSSLACGSEQQPDSPAAPVGEAATRSSSAIGGADASVVAEFNARIQDYMSLHQQLAGTLTPLAKEPTPREIDVHQRALLALIAKARQGNAPGNMFSPEMQTFVRGLLGQVFDGPEGKRLRSSIEDENPVGIVIALNGRYPDSVPLSTMPPDVLRALPALPPELEYRFVGNRLVLVDTVARLIVDIVDNALPG